MSTPMSTAEPSTVSQDARPLDRRAAALADIRAMHDELTHAHDDLDQLRIKLHREADRVALLIEERNRYRHENVKLRTWLVELSTQMANVHLMTIKGTEILRSIDELNSEEVPPSEALDRLEAEFAKGNGTA